MSYAPPPSTTGAMSGASLPPVPLPPAKSANRKRSLGKNKKKETPENAPVFLRKTYHMIDTCDPSIATWSDDGTKFVVKDPETFAAKIIPQFFKHNNFSSFVRQLNFYGFRKIKTDHIKLSSEISDAESKYWRFRHEKFQRGRPELLSEIKKANQTESPDKQEVEALKKEVRELKGRFANMSRDMDKLTAMLQGLVENRIQETAAAAAGMYDPPHKKPKLQHPSTPGHPTEAPIMPLQIKSAPTAENNMYQPAVSKPEETPVYVPGSVAPLSSTGRFDSVGSMSSIDQELLADLFSDHLDANEDLAGLIGESTVPVPDPAASSMEKKPITEVNRDDHTTAASASTDADPKLVKKLHDSLALLPPQMQELFVDRIVATIVNPEAFKHQVDAVTALAAAAVEDAKKRVLAANGEGELGQQELSEAVVPLAAAALGAFLTQYTASLENATQNNNSGDIRPSIVPMDL